MHAYECGANIALRNQSEGLVLRSLSHAISLSARLQDFGLVAFVQKKAGGAQAKPAAAAP